MKTKQAPASGRGGKHRGKPRPGRGAVLLTLAMALLAALTVLLCALGGVFDFVSSDAEKMPSVVGQTEENARQTLEALGLQVEVRTAASQEAAGIVTAQSIPEGKALKSNQTVKLTVSDGSLVPGLPEDASPREEVFSAPDVRGELFPEAQRRTEDWGLNLIVGSEQYSDQPKGTILWQEPAPGEELRRGAAIRVGLSLGPEESYVITVTCGKGGALSPEGRVSVKTGESAVFEILPEGGYVLDRLLLDGERVECRDSFTLSEVRADHSLYALFRALEEGEEPPETENPGNGEEQPGETPPSPGPRPASPSDIG